MLLAKRWSLAAGLTAALVLGTIGVAAAEVAAAPAPPVPAQGGIKQEACSALGCPDETDLECAEAEIEVDIGPVSGSVTIYCYEPER